MKNLINYVLILLVKLMHVEYWGLPASLIYAQAFHETGGFKSAIYRENKNLFGMKQNSRKYHRGSNRGHAQYDSKIDSIKDYYERQIQFKISYKNVHQYIVDTVRSGYAEDNRYNVVWFETYEKFKYFTYLGNLVTPALILLWFFLLRK